MVDAQDLGGRGLDSEIQKRIGEAKATIALFTPQADAAGNVDPPQFVASEFQHARSLDKPTLRIIHNELVLRGLGAYSSLFQVQRFSIMSVTR